MAEKKEKEYKGLKRLRNNAERNREPIYHCDNCKCNRYSPCHCMKKGDK